MKVANLGTVIANRCSGHIVNGRFSDHIVKSEGQTTEYFNLPYCLIGLYKHFEQFQVVPIE